LSEDVSLLLQVSHHPPISAFQSKSTARTYQIYARSRSSLQERILGDKY
jgi:hypothetical protein